MSPIPVTLSATAAATVLNLWLGSRIVKSRRDNGVKIGDGGKEAVLRRMRAQANYVENAPFLLILLGALEISGASRIGLAVIAALFILARIAHPIGMDGPDLWRWRMYGMIASTLAQLALALWAIFCAVRTFA